MNSIKEYIDWQEDGEKIYIYISSSYIDPNKNIYKLFSLLLTPNWNHHRIYAKVPIIYEE